MELAAVTHGAAGSTWITANGQGTVPGFPVSAVDTTGAGDAFMAGLLASLPLDPGSAFDAPVLDRACRYGNAMGAITATVRGAIPAIPDQSAVAAFLAAQGRAAD